MPLDQRISCLATRRQDPAAEFFIEDAADALLDCHTDGEQYWTGRFVLWAQRCVRCSAVQCFADPWALLPEPARANL